ncbi:MAG TPA: helix-hairpin-helix domain-containing protein [Candidatus Mediterraneibacter stercoripullorum]|nr:helix-hairpin-helix domain-containing protein [Candidatus Mediterraneibacter stercoripullorum]
MLNKYGKWKIRLIIITVFVTVLSLAGCGVEHDDVLQEISVSEDDTADSGAEAPDAVGTDTGGDTSGDENGGDAGEEKNWPDDPESSPVKAGTSEETGASVFVYVCGAVKEPGVYELEKGARVFEAVELAGGATEDAAQEILDQARTVTDGETIYMPTEEEAGEYERNLHDGQSGSGLISDGGGKEKVNINTAGKEELMTLTGIGEAKAQSILDYRDEHGEFQSTEELMEISGIKEGVFNKIKDEITI